MHITTGAAAFSNLPHSRNPYFCGRQGILETMKSFFTSTTRSWSLPVFALYGLSGVGKIKIAIEHAFQHRHEYDYIFWMRGGDTMSVRSDLVRVALGVSGSKAIDELVLRKVAAIHM
jgi:hypothetical protein